MAELGMLKFESEINVRHNFADWQTAAMWYANEGMGEKMDWAVFLQRLRGICEAVHSPTMIRTPSQHEAFIKAMTAGALSPNDVRNLDSPDAGQVPVK